MNPWAAELPDSIGGERQGKRNISTVKSATTQFSVKQLTGVVSDNDMLTASELLRSDELTIIICEVLSRQTSNTGDSTSINEQELVYKRKFML